ncbi:hypothetical protein EX30DRAFT_58458 [Ascodesmis nigricans]|uniref:ABC transmembrane type-1 domain-containing protein n=1 Tax=Ascodesmis nigricans TaxID=341454 RepID=A0A4S2MUY5_9PEZI|nr:hypothetical protein EX30DRAFT_58458 [Ascodesmis nigricans]
MFLVVFRAFFSLSLLPSPSLSLSNTLNRSLDCNYIPTRATFFSLSMRIHHPPNSHSHCFHLFFLLCVCVCVCVSYCSLSLACIHSVCMLFLIFLCYFPAVLVVLICVFACTVGLIYCCAFCLLLLLSSSFCRCCRCCCCFCGYISPTDTRTLGFILIVSFYRPFTFLTVF